MARVRDWNKLDELTRSARGLRAARIHAGLSRKELASRLGWKSVSIEQIENARCEVSEERFLKILKGIGISTQDFQNIKKDPDRVIAESSMSDRDKRQLKRRPRRNHFKVVTKETRVLAVLRKRQGLSQLAASRACSLAPSAFGHIEAGRITLTEDLIKKVLAGLGASIETFRELISKPVLRDELMDQAQSSLELLDDKNLKSALKILNALRGQPCE